MEQFIHAIQSYSTYWSYVCKIDTYLSDTNAKDTAGLCYILPITKYVPSTYAIGQSTLVR